MGHNITGKIGRLSGAGARRLAGVVGLAAGAAMVLLGISDAAAQTRAAQGCTIYYHADFRGASAYLEPGENTPWYGSRWNDQVSSVSLGQGCRLEIWEHVTFQGLKAVITRDTPFIGPVWNDRISSSMCRCDALAPPPRQTGGRRNAVVGQSEADAPRRLSRRDLACVVYRDRNFRGPWRAFTATEDRRRLGRRLANQVSSIRVAPGCTAAVDVGSTYRLFVEDDTRTLPASIRDSALGVDCFCP